MSQLIINQSPAESSWRLVYCKDKLEVIALFYSAGVTATGYELFISQSKQECLDKIASLGLAYTEEHAEE
jgi:hypothetical protein